MLVLGSDVAVVVQQLSYSERHAQAGKYQVILSDVRGLSMLLMLMVLVLVLLFLPVAVVLESAVLIFMVTGDVDDGVDDDDDEGYLWQQYGWATTPATTTTAVV